MSEYNQRVHGREAHGEPAEKDSLFERCMRMLQGFDFEIDNTGGKASSCAAGLLPCMHGPCATHSTCWSGRLSALSGGIGKYGSSSRPPFSFACSGLSETHARWYPGGASCCSFSAA